MTTGKGTYNGLAVPINGESEIVQQTAATDILTLTGASGQSGDFLVCRSSAGVEKVSIDSDGDTTLNSLSLASYINKMVLGTIALGALTASTSTSTVALTGITTKHAIMIFASAAGALPVVWPSTTNVLAYGAPGVATAAQTVNYWMFETA